MKLKSLLSIFVLLLFPLVLSAQQKEAPEGAKTYVISPQHGEVVPQTFTIKFGLHGMGIAPAGNDIEGAGHHHLLIDVKELPDLTLPLPSTDQVRHFGLGQTETVVTLPPGKHTLQLIVGDYAHIPHKDPVMSKKITIHVSE
ncbi:MAG: DUF4399 domain-containing protein [Balneolaceae bacterium]